MSGLRWTVVPVLLASLALANCGKRQNAEEAPPARTVTVATQQLAETATLTGHVAAEDEAALSFRIGGRMMERLVNVGDHVVPGEVLAMLDPQDEVNALRSAQSTLAAADAELHQTTAAFERQRTLLAQGHTTRSQYDLAEKAMLTARARLQNAEVQVNLAGDRVSYTMLTSDAEGAVTARGAEPGEVVQAGQMIVRMARVGGRDAVFGVSPQVLRAAPTNPDITVSLANDPSVEAAGVVREVAPQAEANRQPAVWVVDPAKLTVSLRGVKITQFNPDSVVVTHGPQTGDIVVTAGVQELHPGQQVRLLGSS